MRFTGVDATSRNGAKGAAWTCGLADVSGQVQVRGNAPDGVGKGTNKNRVWQVLFAPVKSNDAVPRLVDDLGFRRAPLLCCVVGLRKVASRQ